LSCTAEEPQLGFQLFLSLFHSYVIGLNTCDLSGHSLQFTLYLTFLRIGRLLVVLDQADLKQILIFEPVDMLKQSFLVEIDVEIIIFVGVAYLNFLRSLLHFLGSTFGLCCLALSILRFLISRITL
jgi:hypothetical protein